MKNSRCEKVHVTYNSGMTIDAGELINSINELLCSKSPDVDAPTAEYIKFVDS